MDIWVCLLARSIDDLDAVRYCSREHLKEIVASIFHAVFSEFSFVDSTVDGDFTT